MVRVVIAEDDPLFAAQLTQFLHKFSRESGQVFQIIFFGECINFPLQRNVTFKSHGPLVPQLVLHFLATVVVFLVMNLFTCVWNPVTNALIPNAAMRNTIQSIVTTVVTGGVAMVIIFAVDNKIFAPDFGKR